MFAIHLLDHVPFTPMVGVAMEFNNLDPPENETSVLGLRVMKAVEIAGKRIEAGAPAALLTALALLAPEMAPADVLVSAVWGDDPPRTWQSALRTHVATARRLLVGAAVPLRIESVGGGLRLVGRSSDTDVGLLRAALDQVHTGSHRRPKSIMFRRRSGDADDATGSVDSSLAERVERALALWSPQLAMSLRDGSQLHHAWLDLCDEIDAARLKVASLTGSGGSAVVRLAGGAVSRPVATEVLARLGRSAGHGSSADGVNLDSAVPLSEPGTTIFLVEGSGGTGKSTIASLAASQAAAAGWTVISARCEISASPLQTIHELLGRWNRTAAPVGRPEHSLGVLFDELASRSGCLMIVEDAHWADAASASGLRRLVGQGLPPNAALLLTARTEARSGVVANLFREFGQRSDACRVELSNFGLDELFELVQLRRPTQRVQDSWADARRLFELSNGHPLLADLLLEHGLRWESLPTGVAQVVEHDLDELRPDYRRVLCAGALLGASFEVRIAAEVCALTAAVVLDAIDAGHSVGLMVQRVGVQGTFRHELVRTRCAGSLGARLAADIHQRCADVLERRGAASAEVAVHRAHALLNATDSVHAVRVVEAAEKLATQLQWDSVLRVLRAAEAALELQPWISPPELDLRRGLLLARATQAVGGWSEARILFAHCFQVAEHSHDLDGMAAVAFESAGSSQPIGIDPQRLEWLREVHARAIEGSENRIRAAAEIVYLDSVSGEATADGEALIQELRGILNQADSISPRLRCFTLHGLLTVDVGGPHMRQRRVEAESMLDLPRSAEWTLEAEAEGTLRVLAMSSALQCGDRIAAAQHLNRFVHTAEQRGRLADVWLENCVRGVLAEWDGDFGAADDYVAAALDLAVKHDIPDGLESWLVFVAARAIRTGDWSALLPAQPPDIREFDKVPLELLSLGLCLDAVDGSGYYSAEVLDLAIDRLEQARRSVAWIPSAVALCVAAERSAGQAAARLTTLLKPYAGTFLVTPFVPVAVFGRADDFMARLSVVTTRPMR